MASIVVMPTHTSVHWPMPVMICIFPGNSSGSHATRDQDVTSQRTACQAVISRNTHVSHTPTTTHHVRWADHAACASHPQLLAGQARGLSVCFLLWVCHVLDLQPFHKARRHWCALQGLPKPNGMFTLSLLAYKACLRGYVGARCPSL
jgi:hypothetical protein